MLDNLRINLPAEAVAGGKVIPFVQLTPQDLGLGIKKKKRHRVIDCLVSFVLWLSRWGNAEKGTIYYTNTKVVAVLDEEDLESGKGNQETVSLEFTRPIVAKRWIEAIGRSMSHKAFNKFLELRHGEMTGGQDLYARVSNLSIATNITYDSKIQDNQTYQIGFKSEAGPGVARLPRYVEVNIPLIEGLPNVFTLVLRLEMEPPKKDDEVPVFTLHWDDQADVLEAAARLAVEEVKKGLPNWLAVKGQPGSID